MKWQMVLIVSILGLGLAPSVGPARQPTRATDTEVTLIIYSGRVDPVWVLTPAEAREFRARLKQLPVAQTFPEPPTRLGTLQVLMPDPGHARRQEVSLDHGKVTWQDRKWLHGLSDPDRKLETWLLATGKGRTSETARWFGVTDLDHRSP
jgi:hypothetical protein